jgi:hypothetical protein
MRHIELIYLYYFCLLLLLLLYEKINLAKLAEPCYEIRYLFFYLFIHLFMVLQAC